MRLCEEKVKSGGSQGEVRGKSGKIGSDLLFALVRIRFTIRTYSLQNIICRSSHNKIQKLHSKPVQLYNTPTNIFVFIEVIQWQSPKSL